MSIMNFVWLFTKLIFASLLLLATDLFTLTRVFLRIVIVYISTLVAYLVCLPFVAIEYLTKGDAEFTSDLMIPYLFFSEKLDNLLDDVRCEMTFQRVYFGEILRRRKK